MLYFTTNTSSLKVAQLREAPKAVAYFCLPKEWCGLQVGGLLTLVEKREVEDAFWQENWEMYYPGGRDGGDYAILRLTPMFAEFYHQMQNDHFQLAAGERLY